MTQHSIAPPTAGFRLFQRHWTWWFMVIVLALVALVRLRLLNFPLERDEGEYAYAGQLMLQGIPPYKLAYNMKFPGTYAGYAVIMALFGETPAGIHFGILLLTTATALMLFWLGKKILDPMAGTVAASTYALLAASPSMLGLAGHATHFVAFFATAGLCVMWKARQNSHWLNAWGAGFLFGLAVLMKQPAALIGFWALVVFAIACLGQSQMPVGRRLWQLAAFCLGMVLPFGVCCWIIWRAGVFEKFWFWTVTYAIEYASIVPIAHAPNLFLKGFCWVITKGILLWLIAFGGLVLVWCDKRWKTSRVWFLGFCAASAASTCPDFYFRKHYFLLALPAVALLAGATVSGLRRFWERKIATSQLGDWPSWSYAVVVVVTVLSCADIWFWLPPNQIARNLYGTDPLPEAELIAMYIRNNSTPDARVIVLGSEPEIYFLSQRHSATGYIYTYGLLEKQTFARQMEGEMLHDLETQKPEFIVFTDNPLSWSRHPGSDLTIFRWWDDYKTNYTLVGLSDILSTTRTINVWGTNAIARYSEIHGNGLQIFQRK